MKKTGVFLCVVLTSVSLMAQVRTGTIWGHVTDAQGAPLPGVSVSLKSTYSAIIRVVTDEQGIYRFFSLEPSKEYALRAELQGFKKQEKTGIIVVIGQQSRIDLVMEQGKIEEEVTVIAQTPTVDAKKVTVGKSVTQDILQSLPTSRDPWNVIQMVPGVIMDRENVGGSESGTQSNFYAKGDPTGGWNNVWALDGVVITDPGGFGPATYFDFDSFEEMNIVTGGADATIQTGGVALNMVTRRGGNKVSLGGRFYLTDSYFQANNLTPALEAQGVTATNKINQIKDYGFNLGGPVIKDKVWLWMSYGIQDVNLVTIIGSLQNPVLTNYNFKLNIQPIASNRFEAMYIASKKTMTGRNSSQSFPTGFNQGDPYHFGSPIIKLQDEQMIGNDLLLSAKFGWMGDADSWISASDPNQDTLTRFDETNVLWNNQGWYITRRPAYNYEFHTQYFNDKLLGMSHEIKLGVEYSTRRATTDSTTPGQLIDAYNLFWGSLDPTASGNPQVIPGMNLFDFFHHYNLDWNVKALAAFVQDTVTTRRFTFLLGLRFDRQTPSINSSTYATVDNNPVWAQYFDPAVSAALAAYMPGTVVPNIKPAYHWNVLSPRLGITYDLFGTGKTILKLSGSMYGDFMGTSRASYWNPQGTSGWMTFYWLDGGLAGGLQDGKVQANELYTYDPVTYAPVQLLVSNGSSSYMVNPYFTANQYGINWYGFTPGSTASTPSPYTVDPNATSTHTWEVLATLEHEVLPDFSISLQATYRKYDHQSWDVPFYANGPYGDYSINGQNVILGPSDYSPVGTIPSSITYTDNNGNTQSVNLGAGAGRTFYLLQSPFQGTPYTIHTLNTNYNTYWGVDLTFNKRLSHKWMFDGSLSYMDQRQHYGSGVTDPTNLWALQDTLTAPAMGANLGKLNAYIFSHWMLKLEGLYQLPLGFNISFTFNARAGYLIPHYMTIVDYDYSSTNPADTGVSTYLDVFGNLKLPTFYQLNLRLEKMVKLGETGRIYLMADAFNVTNAAIIDRRYDMYEGAYYINSQTGNSFVPYPLNYTVNEILNPFIMRLGVRFQF
jgi:hypothetical protein